MSKQENRETIRNWSYGATVISLIFIAILHLHVTRVLPESVYNLAFTQEKILPLSVELRYIFRALYIFTLAYGSMAIPVNPNMKIKSYGMPLFILASLMMLYGYFPALDWYNAFVFPILPFIILFNAKHLPVVGFKRTRREDYYNHYNREDKKGSIRFPLQKTRVKSVVDSSAEFAKPLVLKEPDETTLIQAGTGKGKSRGVGSWYIDSCIRNGWNVIIHDYKGNPHDPRHPELTKFAVDSIRRQKADYDVNVVGFTDPLYTKRVNIFDPIAIKNEQDIRGVNQSLMYSLNKSWKKSQGDPFWKDNTMAIVNGWTLAAKAYKPEILTLPHLVALSLNNVDDMVDAINHIPDHHIKVNFQSFLNAYSLAKETAGSIISSTQIPLVALNDPVMFWALSGNSLQDDFFALDLENTKKPFVLSVCNNGMQPVHTHGINPYIRTILARLNSSTNRPTALILDEFPRIYVDGIDAAIATVRDSGVKICIMIQTYKQLVEEFSVAYADNIMDLCQNKFYGGGSSVDAIKKYVDSYVPKYQDLELSLNQSSSDDTSGIRTNDKKIVEVPEVAGQEKFHFSGVLSTGDPNTFFNLPFKVNELDVPGVKLPHMNGNLSERLRSFREMTKTGLGATEAPVSKEEAQVAYDQYVKEMLESNRDKIFREADEFITDLKHGLV